MTMKTVITYLTMSFSFELLGEKYQEKHSYPHAHFGIMGKKDPIMVKLTPYAGFQD